VSNIVSGRTRGKKIDYAKEAAAAGKDLVEDDEDEDDEYVQRARLPLTRRGLLPRTSRNKMSCRQYRQNLISRYVCWIFAHNQMYLRYPRPELYVQSVQAETPSAKRSYNAITYFATWLSKQFPPPTPEITHQNSPLSISLLYRIMQCPPGGRVPWRSSHIRGIKRVVSCLSTPSR
jgi:Histone chaperone domain CHZ